MSVEKYLDARQTGRLWAKVKAILPSKTSDLTNDSGFITIEDVPPGSVASLVTPIMDGTADRGTDNGFARGDHVHPTDTSRAAAVHGHAISDVTGLQTALDGKADDSDIPTKTSDLTNDSGFLTQHQDISGKLDTDGDGKSVTVTFSQASSRTNIASGNTLATTLGRIKKWLADLGTLAFKSEVAKTDLASGVQSSLDLADTALQSFTETDPTVPSWAKASSKPSYTASEVGAVPTSRTINGQALSSDITLSIPTLSDSTSSTSTTVAASSKAVKTVNDRLTYGSTDLTAGSSALTTGVYYAYYE